MTAVVLWEKGYAERSFSAGLRSRSSSVGAGWGFHSLALSPIVTRPRMAPERPGFPDADANFQSFGALSAANAAHRYRWLMRIKHVFLKTSRGNLLDELTVFSGLNGPDQSHVFGNSIGR